MKLLEPIERIRHQEVSYLVPAIVEDIGTPVGMFAFARVEVFIQGRTVETRERKSVFRKMRGHPIHDYAYSALMEVVDEITKVIRSAVASGRRVVVADLITPGRAVR